MESGWMELLLKFIGLSALLKNGYEGISCVLRSDAQEVLFFDLHVMSVIVMKRPEQQLNTVQT